MDCEVDRSSTMNGHPEFSKVNPKDGDDEISRNEFDIDDHAKELY